MKNNPVWKFRLRKTSKVKLGYNEHGYYELGYDEPGYSELSCNEHSVITNTCLQRTNFLVPYDHFSTKINQVITNTELTNKFVRCSSSISSTHLHPTLAQFIELCVKCRRNWSSVFLSVLV